MGKEEYKRNALNINRIFIFFDWIIFPVSQPLTHPLLNPSELLKGDLNAELEG